MASNPTPLSAPHRVRQALCVSALGLSLGITTGCQSLSGTSSFARVRVIDVSPDTPPVDIYQGGNAMAYNLSFGAVTSYVQLAPGNYTFTVDSAGSRQVLSSAEGSFAAGTQYTLLIGNPAASLQQSVLTDRSQPPASGVQLAPSAPAIRFIHQAGRVGSVDIYLVPAGQRLRSVTPIVANLAAGGNTGYLAVPPCTCTAVVLPAGAVPSAAIPAVHTGTQIKYLNGSARTLILLDPQPNLPSRLQVITTVDAEPLN